MSMMKLATGQIESHCKTYNFKILFVRTALNYFRNFVSENEFRSQ